MTNWPAPGDDGGNVQPSPIPRRLLGCGGPVWLLAIAAIVILAVINAGGDDDRRDELTARQITYRNTVDMLADDRDCRSLQARFDDWADGFDANPAGSERADDFLWGMNYADDAMRRIGCYD